MYLALVHLGQVLENGHSRTKNRTTLQTNYKLSVLRATLQSDSC